MYTLVFFGLLHSVKSPFNMKVVTLLALFIASSNASKLSDLKQTIFSSYDKEVDPEWPIRVRLIFHLVDLSYCPRTQILWIHAYLVLGWTDKRLTWNPSSWDGIEKM